ncbi:MAG: hypothetical protein ACXWZS_10730 [Gemmatirosa sp.]
MTAPIRHTLRTLALATLVHACAPAERAPADSATTTAAPTDTSRPSHAAPDVALDTAAAATGALGPLLERAPGPCGAGGPTADTLCYRAERRADLAGDGRPFTITVDARGPRPDSMAVHVRVARGDTTWYAAHWNTDMHGRYDAAPLPSASDSVRRRTTAHLARLLRDSAFLPVRAMQRGAQDPARMLRETIAYDVAESKVRARRGLAPSDTLPHDALREVSTAADPASPGARADSTRVRTLADEVIGRLGWRFHRGGEHTSGIAWSEGERRFVSVFSCC